MKKIYLLFLLISFRGFSQLDRNNSISIPATQGPVQTAIPEVKTPNTSIFDTDKTPKSDRWQIGGEKGIIFGDPGESFADPGEKYLKKMQKSIDGPDNQPAMKGNQFFGEFRSNGAFVNLKFRDHGYPDGDKIKISVNEKVVIASITLDVNFGVMDLPLEKGFNKIDFEALNQGLYGPNTAEFHVFDDKGKLVAADRWNLATGFKATVIIIKED
ncbi:hypothetical protein GV828_08325 [Flavobacterium sp. NST-5]|uniref:Secreted protein n=1 Tax=Flavobacterium ichthyis TaxID=2698827 RepID=A0ABW9Z938_9FLAO|nr:hypothetical protein [Flavobacterium ichthyis]NBL65199.1 hypothetical protein [Flavobacterium ichthyis]